MNKLFISTAIMLCIPFYTAALPKTQILSPELTALQAGLNTLEYDQNNQNIDLDGLYGAFVKSHKDKFTSGSEEAKAFGYSAAEVVRKLASSLGGSGGGTASFAQGGGPETNADNVRQVMKSVDDVISSMRA